MSIGPTVTRADPCHGGAGTGHLRQELWENKSLLPVTDASVYHVSSALVVDVGGSVGAAIPTP